MVSLIILDSATNLTLMCVHFHYQIASMRVWILTWCHLPRSMKSSPAYVLSKSKPIQKSLPKQSMKLSVLRRLQLICAWFYHFLYMNCGPLTEIVWFLVSRTIMLSVSNLRQLGDSLLSSIGWGRSWSRLYIAVSVRCFWIMSPFESVTDLGDSDDVPGDR